MALVVKDRVKETTTTTGTGTVTLAGAKTDFQSFSVIGDGNTTYYCIQYSNTNEWEVGIGTYTASGTTLSRDTVLESSNSGSLVDFSAGTKEVFVTYPAEKSVYGQSSGLVDVPILSINGTTVTSTAAELNTLGGFTGTKDDLNYAKDLRATGVTSTEFDYLDGVTSAIQTQLDGKQALDADLTAIAGLSSADGNFIVGSASGWVAESGATARTSLGLGSLATLSAVGASEITDNSVGAAELNVSGNGTTSQYLRSDGDGTFTWATPPDTNTTYSAGAGLDLSTTTFSVESDLRGDVFYIGRDTNDYYGVETTTHNWYLDGNLDMRLENDGDLHVDGNVVAYSATTSDPRLKDNIQKVEGALEKVEKLTGYTFTYKVDGRESAGVMSTEVREVLPSAVRSTTLPLKSPNGEDDQTEYDVVQYDQLHALLIEAVKELTARVKELEDK